MSARGSLDLQSLRQHRTKALASDSMTAVVGSLLSPGLVWSSIGSLGPWLMRPGMIH